MSLKNQAVAQRLAVCNDIGEAAYVASLVAAGMVDSMLQTPTGPAIAEAFTQRCGSGGAKRCCIFVYSRCTHGCRVLLAQWLPGCVQVQAEPHWVIRRELHCKACRSNVPGASCVPCLCLLTCPQCACSSTARLTLYRTGDSRHVQGDEERAGQRLLKDYRQSNLGIFAIEQPPRQ